MFNQKRSDWTLSLYFTTFSSLFRPLHVCQILISCRFQCRKPLMPQDFPVFWREDRREKLRFFRLKSESRKHGICRGQLCAVIQMCVDVCRSWEVTVTKPFLNLLHGNTVCQKQRGAAMPLRYNYDKPEKPRISRVVGLWQGFSSFSKPKNRAAK